MFRKTFAILTLCCVAVSANMLKASKIAKHERRFFSTGDTNQTYTGPTGCCTPDTFQFDMAVAHSTHEYANSVLYESLSASVLSHVDDFSFDAQQMSVNGNSPRHSYRLDYGVDMSTYLIFSPTTLPSASSGDMTQYQNMEIVDVNWQTESCQTTNVDVIPRGEEYYWKQCMDGDIESVQTIGSDTTYTFPAASTRMTSRPTDSGSSFQFSLSYYTSLSTGGYVVVNDQCTPILTWSDEDEVLLYKTKGMYKGEPYTLSYIAEIDSVNIQVIANFEEGTDDIGTALPSFCGNNNSTTTPSYSSTTTSSDTYSYSGSAGYYPVPSTTTSTSSYSYKKREGVMSKKESALAELAGMKSAVIQQLIDHDTTLPVALVRAAPHLLHLGRLTHHIAGK